MSKLFLGLTLPFPESFSLVKLAFLYLFMGLCVCMNLPWACGGQSTTDQRQFSPFSVWILGVELGSLGLVANDFNSEPSFEPSEEILNT